MKCRDFQKMIPDIIEKKVPDNMLEDVINHLESCKDCYDELEIYYVLQYGLGDDDSTASMNFVAQIEDNIKDMKRHLNHIENATAVYALTQISAYTAIAGSIIYVLFKLFI